MGGPGRCPQHRPPPGGSATHARAPASTGATTAARPPVRAHRKSGHLHERTCSDLLAPSSSGDDHDHASPDDWAPGPLRRPLLERVPGLRVIRGAREAATGMEIVDADGMVLQVGRRDR